MRIPEKPPDVWNMPDEESREFNKTICILNNNWEGYEQIKAILNLYNDSEYIHWDDFRRKKNLPYDQKALWRILKTYRSGAGELIKIDDEYFKFILLKKFQKTLHHLDMGYILNEKLDKSAIEQYLANSLMYEALYSSQLEGAATTRTVAIKLLRENKKPKDRSQQMIVNNYRTISELENLKDEPLTPDLILRIHREITRNTLESPEDENAFRDSNEIVVRDKQDHNIVYHIPPDYKKIHEMIRDLCEYVNDEEKFIHPIIKAIIVHFLIGYIHPFNDGNGRTARALFYWYVLKKGYWLFHFLSISEIFLKSTGKYTRAFLLSETDENDMTYFIDFNLKIINKSMDNLKEYIVRRQKEQKEALLMAEENPELSFREAQILKDMISEPDKYFTVGEVAGKYKITQQTARKDLQKLESLGYARIKIDKKRHLFRMKNS